MYMFHHHPNRVLLDQMQYVAVPLGFIVILKWVACRENGPTGGTGQDL